MGFFTQFYLKPRLTILAVLVILVGAFAAVGTLGRQEDPTLVERFATLLVTLPGADAEQIESELTEPLESALLELPEIGELSSFSATGRVQMSIELLDSLSESEVEEAWTKVRGQLDSVRTRLPANVETFDLERIYIGAHTLVASLQWQGEGAAPLNIMARLGQSLTLKLRNVSGTEIADNFGLPSEEIRVIPDEEELASLGLSLTEFAALLTRSDTNIPAGRLRTAQGNITLEVDGAIDSLERLASLPVLTADYGGVLQLQDLATIERGVEYPPRAMALSNGAQSIFVVAAISPNLRVDQWSAEARGVLDEFRATLPSDIAVKLLFDQNEYTTARLNGLTRNLAFSALIVFFVVWATIGLRGAIVVGSALPLTIACVLCVFLVTGKTLHQMSITGLVIALGLLIDNAIVVVDEYNQERDRGVPPLESIQNVLGFLFAPLAASTLTTVLAFTPIAILPGPSGEFVGMIGFSVIMAVGASFIIALTVIPAFAGWLDPGVDAAKRPKTWWRDGVSLPILREGYKIMLHGALKWPGVAILICVALVAVGMVWRGFLPSQFFPATERNQLEVYIELPPESSVIQTAQVAQDVTNVLLEAEGAQDVHLVIGQPAPRVYYNTLNLGEGFEGRAAGWVEFETAKQARNAAQGLQDGLMDMFPAYEIRVTPFTQGPPVRAPLEVLVTGEDLTILDDLGQRVRLLLTQTPGVTYTRAGLVLGSPVLTFEANDVDNALTGQSGVGLVGRLRAESQGIDIATIQEDYQQIPVRVLASRERRNSLESLLGTLISTPNAESAGVSLADLGETSLQAKTVSIVRKDGQRINEISAFLDPYHLPAPALEYFKQQLADSALDIPAGYSISYGGEEEAAGETNSSLAALAIPIFLVMLGGIALVFNSFRMAGIIMLSGVMSAGFAFAAIGFFNLPLGFNAIIGVLSLLGIAINGSIVVAALLQESEAAMAGDIEAQVDVVIKSTRHIIATTLTTIGGFVPLLIQGDSFWMPFAAAIAGGAAGSAVLALVFTPVMCRVLVIRPRKRAVDIPIEAGVISE